MVGLAVWSIEFAHASLTASRRSFVISPSSEERAARSRTNCRMWYRTDGCDRNRSTTGPSVPIIPRVLDDLDVRELPQANPLQGPPNQVSGLQEDEPTAPFQLPGGLDDDLDPCRIHEHQAGEIEREIPADLDLVGQCLRQRRDVREVDLTDEAEPSGLGGSSELEQHGG